MYSKLARGDILRSTLVLVPCGVALFAGRLYWRGDEPLHDRVLMPLVRRLFDPEAAHRVALLMCRYRLYPPAGDMHKEYDSLRTTVFGAEFASPVGLAAGFDKDCSSLAGLCQMGFGSVEVGTVTPLPQLGNDKPRVFRLVEDRAVVNRYGFNNVGIGRFATNLAAQRPRCGATVVGVNIGKNRDTPGEDAQFNYASLMHYVGDKCDYVVVNVSSPNTKGLRRLQETDSLRRILREVRESRDRLALQSSDDAGGGGAARPNNAARRPPAILVKLSPDLSDERLAQVCAVCTDARYAVDGIVMGNTSTGRPDTLKSPFGSEKGGLSGAPLKQLSTEKVRKVYALTAGRVPIVGCGGTFSGRDAYEKIRAGASLVQVYTALVYAGFPVVGAIKRQLDECLRADGFSNVAEAVGADHRKK